VHDDEGNGRGEPGELRAPLADQRDQARRHPLRLAILAIFTNDGALTVSEIADELPGTPKPALLRYHLEVLRQAELISESRRDPPISSVWSSNPYGHANRA
jgi:predicted ArsR family transcriptional regulator